MEEAQEAYGKLPLSFIPNEGQTDEAVRYYAQGAGYGFFFTKEGAMLSFAEGKGRGGHALGLDFLGANPHPTLTAQERLEGEVNYLVGDDPSKWQQDLPTHGELLYGGLWPGIDMAVRGEGGKLKYEFHLKAGSSVDDVRLAYRGAQGLKVGSGGDLLVETSMGVLKDAAPVSYQTIRGERVEVKSGYRLRGDGTYGFWVGSYDPRYPLVIDPGLAYSTFLGGAQLDTGEDIAVRDGNAYVTGRTQSADYPITPGAFDTTLNGFGDAFVTKLNAAGSELAYSTFLGGTRSTDQGSGIAVDGGGNAYVTGFTFNADYPTTDGAFDTTFDTTLGGFADAFVTKLNASGSELAYSTFLGGGNGDEGIDIAVDDDGGAYVTGQTFSAAYPTTDGAFDTTYNNGAFSPTDAFVTKLNASGSALDYSTFLGGTSGDNGFGIAVDGMGSAYVMGRTSAGYPTTPGAYDTSFNGSNDAFVTKLNAAGSELAYSTFLGGAGRDEGSGIAVDGSGSAYLTGQTRSSDYPRTQGAYDTSFNGGFIDAFVTKLNASGSALDNSTFLGGSGRDEGFGIAVDGEGSSYVTGVTSSFSSSSDFPTTSGAYDTSFNGGSNDAFVTKLLYGDFIPPTINVPSDITVDATGPDGALVTYEVTVTDDVDENPTLSCDPASGSTFPIRTTTVECTATDSAGNSAKASFDVVVRGAAEQISNLKETVTNLGLQSGLNRSLQVKLDDALAQLNAGRTVPACSKLDDFISQVSAQSGRQIAPGDAEILITDANRIKAVIGCK